MNLLKYLVIDHVEMEGGETVPVGIDAATGKEELNPFAHALCSLPVGQLRLAHFDLHLSKEKSYSSTEANTRGGEKFDASNVAYTPF